jgi:hypothetical protein
LRSIPLPGARRRGGCGRPHQLASIGGRSAPDRWAGAILAGAKDNRGSAASKAFWFRRQVDPVLWRSLGPDLAPAPGGRRAGDGVGNRVAAGSGRRLRLGLGLGVRIRTEAARSPWLVTSGRRLRSAQLVRERASAAIRKFVPADLLACGPPLLAAPPARRRGDLWFARHEGAMIPDCE